MSRMRKEILSLWLDTVDLEVDLEKDGRLLACYDTLS